MFRGAPSRVMHDAWHGMGSLGHMLQIELPRDWANLALGRDMWRAGSAGAEVQVEWIFFCFSFLCMLSGARVVFFACSSLDEACSWLSLPLASCPG